MVLQVLSVNFFIVQANFGVEGGSNHHQEGNLEHDEVQNLEKAEEPHPQAHERVLDHDLILFAIYRRVEVEEFLLLEVDLDVLHLAHRL
jgi:hypothetical protein